MTYVSAHQGAGKAAYNNGTHFILVLVRTRYWNTRDGTYQVPGWYMDYRYLWYDEVLYQHRIFSRFVVYMMLLIKIVPYCCSSYVSHYTAYYSPPIQETYRLPALQAMSAMDDKCTLFGWKVLGITAVVRGTHCCSVLRPNTKTLSILHGTKKNGITAPMFSGQNYLELESGIVFAIQSNGPSYITGCMYISKKNNRVMVPPRRLKKKKKPSYIKCRYILHEDI